MINRLVDPTSGVIEFADKPLTSYKMRDLVVGSRVCPTADRLVSNHDSGAKHCRDPRNEGLVAPKIRTATDELLTTVDLPPAEYRNRMPSELSEW